MSVWTMMQETVNRVPDRTALAIKRNDEWVKWTYAEYGENVRSIAKGFIELGLQPYHGVGIIGFNSPEWHITNLAAVVSQGLAAGIYTTNSADATRYVLQHSRANVVVVEDQEQLDKVLEHREQMPDLRAIVQYSGEVSHPDVVSWDSLLRLGRSLPDSLLQERLERQAVNQACLLVYTSGTTGNPKGVMMSQDSLTWLTRIIKEHYAWNFDVEEGVSYLPLSHVAAQFIDLYLALFGGATIWFADREALQGSLIKTLVDVRPSRFFAVPRVYEKMQEKLLLIGKQNTGAKKAVADWAKRNALAHHRELLAGRPGNHLSYRIAKRLILSRIHAALGLDKACMQTDGGLFSSAAPLSVQTIDYFMSLDMPIFELLGSSETGGPQTACLPGLGTRLGSVGRSYPHFQTEILNPDKDGVGEIVTRGRNIMMGYIWDEDKTKETIDEDGWVHSGDLGRMDEDGFIFMSGRIKELLITAGGENVAPVPIEEQVKEGMVNVISHVMVIGDKRKHLAVLITLKTVMDKTNQPTEILTDDVKEWLSSLGSSASTARELIKEDNELVHEAFMHLLEKVNKEAVSRAQKLHKYMILPKDFTIKDGDLTPTMKMKRQSIVKKYEKDIEEMYEFEAQSSMW